MLKKTFVISMTLSLAVSLSTFKAIANSSNTSHKIEFSSYERIGTDRRFFPFTTEIYKTSFKKIEYLTSQVAGIGSDRPGTEEFLNAEVIIKLKEDNNLYGFSLAFIDIQGPSKAMFDTLIAALIHDLMVEIVYYEKAGTKQMIKVTVKK